MKLTLEQESQLEQTQGWNNVIKITHMIAELTTYDEVLRMLQLWTNDEEALMLTEIIVPDFRESSMFEEMMNDAEYDIKIGMRYCAPYPTHMN